MIRYRILPWSHKIPRNILVRTRVHKRCKFDQDKFDSVCYILGNANVAGVSTLRNNSESHRKRVCVPQTSFESTY